MKRFAVLMLVALFSLTFSCQKDSLTGLGDEELDMRTETTQYPVRGVKMANFSTDYDLLRVEALPGSATLSGIKPPKGSVPIMYGMLGSATFMGKLDPGMSYEVHYIPGDADLEKDRNVKVFVLGEFVSATDFYRLRYVGHCIYYLDGSRESRYEFYPTAGAFQDVRGWVETSGVAKTQGRFMTFSGEGQISMPALDN